MKVIRKIIDYLYFQHHLSMDDLAVFERMGLLEGTTVGSLLRELARGAEPEPELEGGPSDRVEFIERTEALFDRVATRRTHAIETTPSQNSRSLRVAAALRL